MPMPLKLLQTQAIAMLHRMHAMHQMQPNATDACMFVRHSVMHGSTRLHCA